MGFGQAVASAFANYFNFSGRSRRSEYWYFTLFMVIAAIAATLIDVVGLGYDYINNIGPAYIVYALATIIPALAVSVRRLHDIGRTGWWLLLSFTLVGIILLIYWACQPGEPGPNKYGNPVV